MAFKKIEKNTQGYTCDVTKRSDAEIIVRTSDKIYSLDSALEAGIVSQTEYDNAKKFYGVF